MSTISMHLLVMGRNKTRINTDSVDALVARVVCVLKWFKLAKWKKHSHFGTYLVVEGTLGKMTIFWFVMVLLVTSNHL